MKKIDKKLSLEESNFYDLIRILKKYALSSNEKPNSKSIYKPKKNNDIIVKHHPYLVYKSILGNEYRDKEAELYERKITLNDWNDFLKDFSMRYPGRMERAKHKFELFIYLEKHSFCIDISENEVRTKIMEVPMPDEITGDHNGKLALSFERAIKEQIFKYISQTQTNIDVLTQLI